MINPAQIYLGILDVQYSSGDEVNLNNLAMQITHNFIFLF